MMVSWARLSGSAACSRLTRVSNISTDNNSKLTRQRQLLIAVFGHAIVDLGGSAATVAKDGEK